MFQCWQLCYFNITDMFDYAFLKTLNHDPMYFLNTCLITF